MHKKNLPVVLGVLAIIIISHLLFYEGGYIPGKSDSVSKTDFLILHTQIIPASPNLIVHCPN